MNQRKQSHDFSRILFRKTPMNTGSMRGRISEHGNDPPQEVCEAPVFVYLVTVAERVDNEDWVTTIKSLAYKPIPVRCEA